MNTRVERILACLVFVVVPIAPSLATADDETVRICLTYGQVDDRSIEQGDSNRSIFSRGLATDAPVQFVTVGLYREFTDLLADEGVTGADGCATLHVTETPNRLRIKAKNDYVTVKEAKLIPLPTDSAISITILVPTAVYDGTGEVSLNYSFDDDFYTFTSKGDTFPISRAMFVATSVYRNERSIESLTGRPMAPIEVRLGANQTAWTDEYTGPAKTIHLQGEAAVVIDHEYGHHVEFETGAFGVIPSYLLEQGHAHYSCVQQTLLFDPASPDYCWSFLEGAASFYGAVNSYGFTTDAGVPFFGPLDPADNTLWDMSHLLVTLGDNYWVENSDDSCDQSDRDSWTDPRAVESVVAQVLWDLVDDHPEVVTSARYVPPEIANVPIDKVLEIMQKTIPLNFPCAQSVFDAYSHPVTLEQFCEEYVDSFWYDNPHHVFPDLYAAYAFNGVATTGCATDSGAPGPATVMSVTHPEGEWRNTSLVNLAILSGDDDFSGTYYYWLVWDNSPNTVLDDGSTVIGTQDEESKSDTFGTVASRREGDDQYLHLQTRDLAGHLGTTVHYGPVRIDLTSPDFAPAPTFPAAGTTFIIGRFAHLEWHAYDALSGVADVSINYEDATNGFARAPLVHLDPSVTAYDLYLDPDLFLPTTTGIFSLTVTDKATNARTVVGPSAYTVLSPFQGPNAFGAGVDLDATDGRVVSGDLNSDGRDEIVLSGTIGGARSLKIVKVAPAVAIQNVTPGLSGGDLFLADVDRDGDLDLVAAGDFGGAGPQVYLYTNNGLGVLTSVGALPITAYDNMVIRVVDLFGTGQPILVYGGSRALSSAKLQTYNFATGATGVLTDIVFHGGDFEVGDINGDPYLDFVTLGVGSGGSGFLRTFQGGKVANEAAWSQVGGLENVNIIDGDVDLGNWDADVDLDMFAMYEIFDGVLYEDHTEMREWWQPGFHIEAQGGGVNRIADGDGHIVEIYNDGWADVLALGRRVSGSLSSWYETNSALGEGNSGVPYPIWTGLLYDTDTAWGDFDGDRDLDFVVVGRNAAGTWMTRWYTGRAAQQAHPNANPQTPVPLGTVYDPGRGGYTFRFQAPVAVDETPTAALRYELRVGTAPGANDVVSWAHPAAFSQQVAGSIYATHVDRFVPLALGTYYWSVRTVDTGWRRSAPAPEQNTAAAVICTTVPGDCDGDGVRDACEIDTDGDGIIDDCDGDDDSDGVPDAVDSNRTDAYTCADVDGDGCDDCAGGDGFGAAADAHPDNDGPDGDGDGLCDSGDPCPSDNPNDTDGDGVCDSVDVCPGGADGVDADADGVPDGCDPCPLDNPDDSDGDGICNAVDACPGSNDALDGDLDGVPDACDPCPRDALGDSDGDGICDSADRCTGSSDLIDTDGDLVPDGCDPCPADNPNDSDRDFVCDSSDVCPGAADFIDADADGVPDACDNCPRVANSDQLDDDRDGLGNLCEPDSSDDASKFIKRKRR